MIKFFRKIRQKLLAENKFSKYLLYAIGEIALVVIGILIALQINNWNEYQKINENETIVAKELYKELSENLVLVENQLELWENRDKNILEVIKLTESENVTISNREFDSLMIYVIGFNKFNLKQSKFQRIISSENFEFKKSSTLINDLMALNETYTTLMAYYKFNEENYHHFIQPYLIENYSMKNFDNIISDNKTESLIDFNELLSDLKFANIIRSARGNSAPFVKFIKRSIKKIVELKSQLETVYPSMVVEN